MSKLTPGARNLIILGIGATLIAIMTTSISLIIYHVSGDIYIDRSRPGFLPDKEEISEDESTEANNFIFPESGSLTIPELFTYEKNLQAEIDAIDDYKMPFSETPLSDEALDLPKE